MAMTLDAAAAAELVEGPGRAGDGDRRGPVERRRRRRLRAPQPDDRCGAGDGAAGRSRRGGRRGRRPPAPRCPAWRDMPLPERMAALTPAGRPARRSGAARRARSTRSTTARRSAAMDSGGYAALFVRYYAGWVDKLEGEVVPVHGGDGFDYVVPEPYGVVGAIVPWNGPMMGMGQKCGPALAAGNTVVAKPPEIAPFGAIAFAELAARGGPAARRRERRARRRGGGRGAGAPPRRRQGVVHRWHRHRPARDGGGGRDAQAARARARRQVGQRDLPRRRPRRGRAGLRLPRLHAPQRPGLRAADPAVRPRRRVRRGGRAAGGAGRGGGGGRSRSTAGR